MIFKIVQSRVSISTPLEYLCGAIGLLQIHEIDNIFFALNLSCEIAFGDEFVGFAFYYNETCYLRYVPPKFKKVVLQTLIFSI